MSRTLLVAALCAIAIRAVSAQPAQPVGSADDFIGGYQSASGDVVRVVLEGDRLFRIGSTGQRTEVTPESPVTFLRDTRGRATHMVVGQEKWARIAIPSATLARYVGEYPLAPQLSMMVTLEGDRLMAQATGASRHPLHPLSATRFFVQDAASTDSAELEFGGGEKEPPYVIVHQGGAQQKAMRK